MSEKRLLVVMRHAQAGQAPGRPDRDRPLTGQGRRDAVAAGTWLAGQGVRLDAVSCSPAVRTRQTWTQVRAAGGYPEAEYDERVYQADLDELVQLVAEVPEQVRAYGIVGHNPAVHALVDELTGSPVERFPAGAVALLDIEVPWAEIGPARARLRALRREHR